MCSSDDLNRVHERIDDLTNQVWRTQVIALAWAFSLTVGLIAWLLVHPVNLYRPMAYTQMETLHVGSR